MPPAVAVARLAELPRLDETASGDEEARARRRPDTPSSTRSSRSWSSWSSSWSWSGAGSVSNRVRGSWRAARARVMKRSRAVHVTLNSMTLEFAPAETQNMRDTVNNLALAGFSGLV